MKGNLVKLVLALALIAAGIWIASQVIPFGEHFLVFIISLFESLRAPVRDWAQFVLLLPFLFFLSLFVLGIAILVFDIKLYKKGDYDGALLLSLLILFSCAPGAARAVKNVYQQIPLKTLQAGYLIPTTKSIPEGFEIRNYYIHPGSYDVTYQQAQGEGKWHQSLSFHEELSSSYDHEIINWDRTRPNDPNFINYQHFTLNDEPGLLYAQPVFDRLIYHVLYNDDGKLFQMTWYYVPRDTVSAEQLISIIATLERSKDGRKFDELKK